MDRRQKSTLRGQHIRIADELILDEDFYAALRRDKIFTHSMIDIIKTEPKPRDRVYKMLELLEKRGPKAFDNFTNILRENYDWLAEVLEEEYNKRIYQEQNSHTTNRSYIPHGGASYDGDRYRDYNDVSLPRVPIDRRERAVSSPYNKTRSMRQMSLQDPMSACHPDKTRPQFFTSQSQTTQPSHDMYDATDNLTIAVPNHNSNSDYEKPKKYKDACMSPISVLESARKMVNSTTSPTVPEIHNNLDEPDSAVYDRPNLAEAIPMPHPATTNTISIRPDSPNVARKASNEADSAYSMTDDAESQATEITHVSSSGFPVEGTINTVDEVDGPKDIDTECAINEDDFPSSEIYYDHVRRGSSCMPPETYLTSEGDDEHHDDGHTEAYTEMSDDNMHYDETETLQCQLNDNYEAMKQFYIKLSEAASDTADPDEILEEDEINWEILNEQADKLINRLQNSDDMKMIRRCYSLFPEKERRHALNICIQTLQDGKKEVESELRNKKKEIEDMVFDLWKHQQDISNIKRLRKSVNDLESENKNMKQSLENLGKDFEGKMKLLDEKDAKIQDLEARLKELEPRRGATVQRRGSQNQRQRVVPAQSPRRQGSQYPVDPPRLSVIQSAYGNQSPRPQNITGRRLVNNNRRC